MVQGTRLKVLFLCYNYAGAKPPSITRAPVNTHAFRDGSFTLYCEADHYADIMLWEKNGYAVDVESSRFIIQGDTELSSSLTVMNVSRDDSGVYYCRAENEAGKVNASAVVTVTRTVLTCDGEWYKIAITYKCKVWFTTWCSVMPVVFHTPTYMSPHTDLDMSWPLLASEWVLLWK